MLEVWRRLWDLPNWMRIFMLGQVVNSAGGLAWIYLALYLVQERGLTAGAAGVVAAGYGLGLIGGTFAGGWCGDRFGIRRSMLVSRVGWVLLCGAVPLAPIRLLPALVVLAGLSAGAARPLQFAIVAGALPPERRREGMALSRTASNLGFTIGPPLGALLAAHAFPLVFLVDALTTVVITVIVWRFVPADQPMEPLRRKDPVRIWPALRADPRVLVVLLSVLVVDTVYRQILTPLPLLLHDLGYPVLAFGLLMAANGAIIVVAEAPLAVLLRHRTATAVIAAGYALVGLGCLVVGVAPGLVAASVAIVVITVGEMLYKPTATAHVADSAPPGASARYQSLYAGASIGGMLFAPVLGGLGYQHIPTLLWPLAGVCALGAAAVTWRVGRRAPVLTGEIARVRT
jgi:MFS family permease